MRRYTNKDIANIAGVSPAAVSIAINGKKGIGEETRARILEIVEQVGYFPNPNSRRLLSKRTNNIAVLVRNDMKPIDQMFYTELSTSILDTCNHEEINLVYATLKQKKDGCILPQIIRARDVDGVLIFGDIDSGVLNEISRYEVPFVILDSSLDNNTYPTVRPDYTFAAYTAAKYLIDCGHRDIAYIGSDKNSQKYYNYAIFTGFRNALSEAGISVPMNRIQIDIHDDESLCASIKQLVEDRQRPTALFCSTDVYGCCSLRYLHEQGFKIPEDISIIGIDDILLSRFTMPALTTVCVDREAMGREGYYLLEKCIQGEAPESILLPTTLIVRDSVRILDNSFIDE